MDIIQLSKAGLIMLLVTSVFKGLVQTMAGMTAIPTAVFTNVQV